jgi:hypothetical protein
MTEPGETAELRTTEPGGPDEPRAAETAPRVRRPTRGAILIGARVLTGLVGILIAAVVIGGASVVPLPAHRVTAPSMLIDPVATTQQRLCSGPLLRFTTQNGGAATTPSSFGRPSIRSISTGGRVVSSQLTTTDNSAGVAPTLLTVPAAKGNSRAALVAGSQSQVAASRDDVGFAASDCVAGSGESWLVGGATTTGRSTIITLSNPTEVASLVTLTIYAESGVISAAGTDGILVPPGVQKVFSLAGFAPGVTSPVVRVQSQGGTIVANLQQSVVRTLTPGGVDIVGSSSAPATDTVVPGVVISGSDAVLARAAQVGYSDIAPVLRLFVPGPTDTLAKISVVPENGTVQASTVTSLTLRGGVVTDVPLGSVGDGVYTVRVTGDHPIVAGVRVSTIGASGGTDFAWLASAQAVANRTAIVVAPGPGPTLNIASRSNSATIVTLTTSGSEPTQIPVTAQGAISLPVDPGASYTISASNGVSASVSYLGDGQLAGFTIVPPAAVSQPIRVYR